MVPQYLGTAVGFSGRMSFLTADLPQPRAVIRKGTNSYYYTVMAPLSGWLAGLHAFPIIAYGSRRFPHCAIRVLQIDELWDAALFNLVYPLCFHRMYEFVGNVTVSWLPTSAQLAGKDLLGAGEVSVSAETYES